MAADGRLHTTFHQAVASTGRLSSSDPNLQNIPIRTELGRRDPAGVRGRRADRSSCSPRTTRRSSCGSSPTCRATSTSRTRSRGRPTSTARPPRACSTRHPTRSPTDERSMAKMVNFGLAYGMSDFGLASRANIPRKEAQEFINSYFAAYSGISYYMMAIKEQAKAQGFVETLLGRKRQIPELRAVEPGAARGGRADGDQHADPGHGRGHPEDRDDPGRRAARRDRARAPGCCCRSTTSCCSRSRATRSSRSRRSCARRWRARCRCRCR